jgi:hypothetical protein
MNNKRKMKKKKNKDSAKSIGGLDSNYAIYLLGFISLISLSIVFSNSPKSYVKIPMFPLNYYDIGLYYL